MEQEFIRNKFWAVLLVFVLGLVIVYAHLFYKVYERQVLLQEKATLLQELTGAEAKLRFLYQVCRDKTWDESGDRSACYDIFKQEKKPAINTLTTEI